MEEDTSGDLQEHLSQVKEIFDSLDPTGRKGLNYKQFKRVLVDILEMELDEEGQFEEIVADLDPNGTGFVQFAALQA